MSGDASSPDNKVARVISEYGLEGWGERLEKRWTGAGTERESLRTLAKTLNIAILEAALEDADVALTDPDIESAYQTLTDESVSRADRLRKERELEQEGIPIDAVRSDFVTHQTIHTYLTSHRNAEPPDRSPSPDRDVENVRRLRGRTNVVVESVLDRMIGNGDITDRDYEVFVDIQIVCEDCGSSYEADQLITEGGCDCTRQST